MKNMYTSVLSRWLFILLLLSGQALLAQTAPAPTIQWQKTINIPYTNTAIQSKKPYVVKASGGGYAVATIHNRLLRLSDDGTTRWQVEIPSSQPDLPGLYQVYETAGLLAMPDGGFVVLTADAKFWSLARLDANGKVMWVKSFDDVTPASGGNVTYFYKTSLIRANDGGFIVGGYEGSPRGITAATVYSFSPDGTKKAKKALTFYDPSPFFRSSTAINKIVPAFDGGYIAVGVAASSPSAQPLGWAARIDENLNIIWQNTYALTGHFDDIIRATDGQNYLITGMADAVIPSIAGIRALNGNGQLLQDIRSDTQTGDTYFFTGSASIVSIPNSSPTYSALFVTASSNNSGDDFRVVAPNLKVSLGGTGNDVAADFLTTEDGGYLVVGTTTSGDGDVQGKVGNAPATWIVKLGPAVALQLTQPTYNCTTGAITFNTTGGNGTLISYTAPGIMRSSFFNNSGTVEQGLRNDPKTITITATQSGQSTTYSFDLKAACSGITPAMHPDMQPLVDLYNATNGPSWKNKTNWLTGNSPCNWFGVSCNADGRVTGVSLSYNNLNGTLPSSLGNLSELQRFSIFSEPLVSGSIPASLGNLSKLQLLGIEYTQISGSIPESLGNLKQLTQFYLAQNRLSGTIPESLGNLSNLDILYLFGNELTGSLPSSLANLPKIQTLHLYNNKLSGCIPTAYVALCGKDVKLSDNYALSGGGDFAAFCANPAQNCGPNKLLVLTQPTYNCATGEIRFNWINSDATPITFSAPGITRSSPSSFTGTVEQGLRNDPKVITITGTQSGYSTSYSFDLKAFCGGTPPLVAPALLSPIPDQTRIAGKQLTNDTISISRFFGGVGNYPNFRPVLLFLTTGLPPGMTIFNNSTENRTSSYIGGTPTTPGVYVVTVSAFISNSTSGAVPTTTTKFQITILDSSTPTPPPTTGGGTLTLIQPTYNCSTGAITFNTTGGNGTPISYTAPGITRSSVTSNTGTVEQGLRNDPKTITITATQSEYSTSYSFDLKAFCNATTPGTSTLKLLTPIVDCSLRQVTLVTSGGDGSPITFNTPTITRSSATSSVGIVDLCVGAKPPVLQATQSGFTTTYESFDFAKQCPAFLSVKPLMASQIPDITLPGPDYRVTLGNYFRTETNSINRYAPSFKFQLSGAPDGSSIDDQSSVVRSLQPYAFLTLNISTPGVYTVTVTGRNECEPAASSTFKVTVNPTSGTTPLTLTQPTYDCSTGAFTFNFTGGNGSPVEFQAAGITGWTTNRNQFVDKDSRTASDVKPFMLMARQNGQVVTYTWDLKAACGRSARMATTEAGQVLELTVKGNPVGNTAVVEIRGVEGKAIQLDLLNASGHVLEQRHIEQAGAVDEQRFELQRQPTGLLFLRAQSGQQKQTVKLIKQ